MTATTCVAVILQLATTPVATLGMDGRWSVPDWSKLEQFENAQTTADACYARELRIQHDRLHMTDKVDDTCPGNPTDVTREIIAADPVMATCSDNQNRGVR